MKKIMILLIPAICAAIAAASCAKNPAGTDGPPAATATFTQTAQSATNTISPTDTITCTATLTATDTPSPTDTCTSTPPATATVTPTHINAINLMIEAFVYFGPGPDCGMTGVKWFVDVTDTYSWVKIDYAHVVIKNLTQATEIELPWTELCGGSSYRYYSDTGVDYSTGNTYRVEVTLDGVTYTAERTNTLSGLSMPANGLSLNWSGVPTGGLVTGNACSNYNLSYQTSPYLFDDAVCYPDTGDYYIVASLNSTEYMNSVVFNGCESNSRFAFFSTLNQTINK